MSSTELFGVRYSPWTQKARWALDHHRVPYRYREHMILLGMPELRFRTGKWTGPMTVPLLKEEGRLLMDSWDIARHAEERGSGESLFPESLQGEIEECNRLSERALDWLRVLVSYRVERDERARVEALPSSLPPWLRGQLSGVAHLGIAYLRKEFEMEGKTEAAAEAAYEEGLREIRRRLREGGGEHVVGGKLTYADFALGVVVQGVEPPAEKYLRLKPATRAAWGSPRLRQEFGDLVEWRDRLFVRYR